MGGDGAIAVGGGVIRIAIDARPLRERASSNRSYWAGLVGALRQEPGIELILLDNGRLPGRVWSLLGLPLAAKRAKADVAHVQYTVSPFFRTPVVTTVHDVSFLANPGWFSPKDRFLLSRLVPKSCERAEMVLTVSEFSRREIVQRMGIVEEKVAVAYNGIDARFAPSRERVIEGEYFLGVGSNILRKNWGLAREAVSMLGDAPRLILSGAGHEMQIADEDLPAAYSHATAVLHPSLYEGFGLTPAEAMACGAPVIASNASSLPEVLGDAAILLPPDDPQAWADAICGIGDRREELRKKGLERSKRYTWEAAAKIVAELYRRVATR
ncbi:MAG: glycosyltransferase family 4 protein [Armatimonadetes bacterium]|nr:glycosyltransferase family 4 protein [Armatimonadota bacterium]